MAKTILILGAGAAGIAAAIAAAEAAPPNSRVILLERNPRVGKKLLATGNGRCNLSNAGIAPDRYFTADPAALARCLDSIQKADPLGWFAAHGLYCRAADEAGRIYPYSNQAADLLNLLLDWLERHKVEVLCGVKAQSIRPHRNGWQVLAEDRAPIAADAVICALGGAAGPQFGTDGFGTELARRCGLRCEPLYPCLVPLLCKKTQVTGLSGIRVKGTAALYDGERLLACEEGEVQFTEQGISGIAVMQLSCLLRPGKKAPKEPVIRLDLFPHLSEETLFDLLKSRAAALPGVTAAGFMTGLVHRRVGSAVWKAQKLGPESRPMARVTEAELARLAHGLKDWRFYELAPTGWQQAQTTGGGICLSEIDPATFQLTGCKGLYFVGETLDCAGSCGGFNLHWAFGSGIIAGRHAAAGR